MLEEKIKVSVIIPTYNRTRFIERAVSSVLKQTYTELEIIIVDDNLLNSEESRFIEITFRNMDDRIKIIRTSGKVGGGAARNIGVRVAKGEYIAFLDDDDVFLTQKIEKQLEFTIQNKYDMSIQDVMWFNENNKLVEYRSFSFISGGDQAYMLKQHILHHLAPTSIYMIKKEAFFRTEGFGETKMGQDWRLMLSCILSGLKIGYMEGAYVQQYLHSGERISLGQNKIDGENSLYEIKKQYLYLMNKKEKRYIHFRHYAVLAFACIRSGNSIKAIPYIMIAFFSSPKDSLLEAYKYFKGKRKKLC